MAIVDPVLVLSSNNEGSELIILPSILEALREEVEHSF